jgi:hypothetical protein
MSATDAAEDGSGIDNVVLFAPSTRATPAVPSHEAVPHGARPVSFERSELRLILNLYGRQVAAGEWRDYAIDFSGDRAEFSVMRRTNEMPVYRIRKVPALAKKQGAFCVVSVTGFILKRGHDLRKVLAVLEPKVRLHGA